MPADIHQDKPLPATVQDSVLTMMSLKGKVAIVTGAGTGIGLEIVRGFAEAGADVAMFYNSSPCEDKAEAIAKEFGVKVRAYQCNSTDSDAVTKQVQAVKTDFGFLDIFVANAGTPGSGPVTEMDDEFWLKIVNINFNSVFYAARPVGQIFRDQVANGRSVGKFIVTSSISGHIVNMKETQALYNATKAGCTHFCKSLAYEWRDFARVNIVSPGFIHTKMGAYSKDQQEVNRFNTVLCREGDPRELKGAYLYFASDASSYTTGSELIVDGGYTLP